MSVLCVCEKCECWTGMPEMRDQDGDLRMGAICCACGHFTVLSRAKKESA